MKTLPAGVLPKKHLIALVFLGSLSLYHYDQVTQAVKLDQFEDASLGSNYWGEDITAGDEENADDDNLLIQMGIEAGTEEIQQKPKDH